MHASNFKLFPRLIITCLRILALLIAPTSKHDIDLQQLRLSRRADFHRIFIFTKSCHSHKNRVLFTMFTSLHIRTLLIFEKYQYHESGPTHLHSSCGPRRQSLLRLGFGLCFASTVRPTQDRTGRSGFVLHSLVTCT